MRARATLTVLLLAVAGPRWAAADAAAEGHAWLATRVAELEDVRAQLGGRAAAVQWVRDAVDMDAFSDRLLGDYLEESLSDFRDHLRTDDYMFYVAAARQRVRAALEARLVADLTAQLERLGPGPLRLADADVEDDRGRVVVRPADAETPALTGHLRRRDDGSWRLVDLDVGERSLSRIYRRRYDDTFDERYSPSVLVSQLRGRDYVVLEDFSFGREGDLPVGWHWRDKDDDRRKPYQVHQKDGLYYVAARDSGGSVMLGRLAHWNPRRYPIMTWCWRADALPPGGDERFGHTNDSAAGIYVVYYMNWIGMPRHIKYVWSTTLPTDTVGRRNRIARPYFVVVDSGPEHLGQWRFAQVDLEADFERTYGGRPKPRTQGLGLLTDANSTDSLAEAYYADLRVWTREAWEAGRVQDHCQCYRDLHLPNTAHNAVGDATGAPDRSGLTP